MRKEKKMGMLKILVVICSILMHMIEAERPRLENGTVEYYESRFLGVDFQMAKVELQYDQELYVQTMIVCPGMEQGCAKPPTNCEPCGWSSEQMPCLGTETLQCCQTPIVAEQEIDWCTTASKTWTALKLDQETEEMDVASNKWVYFRFHIDHSDFCKPVEIITQAVSGSVDVFVSTVYPYPDQDRSEWRRFTYWSLGQASLTICPSDPAYRAGTFAIGVRGRYAARFTLSLISNAFTLPAPLPPLLVPCADVPPSYLCLQNGITYYSDFMTAGTRFQFILPVPPGCHTSGVLASPRPDFRTTDVDIYCFNQHPSVDLDENTAIIGSWRPGDDRLTFQTCSPQPLMVHCLAHVWSEGPFSLHWTTMGHIYRYALSDLNPYDFTLQTGRSSAALSITNSALLPCVDWLDGCNTFWPLYPGVGDYPFWPVPSFAATGVDFWDLQPIADCSHQTAKPGLYRMNVVLSRSSGTQSNTFFSNADALLDSASLFMFNIVNADGEAVLFPSENPSVAAKYGVPGTAWSSLAPTALAECSHQQFEELLAKMEPYVSSLATTNDVLLFRFAIDTYSSGNVWNGCLSAAEQLLTRDNITSFTFSTTCSINQDTDPSLWQADPCCNYLALHEFECCSPTLRSNYELAFSDPAPNATASCSSPECAASYLSTLADAINNMNDPITGCISVFNEKEITKIVHVAVEEGSLYCRRFAGIGESYQGVPCTSDADCQNKNPLLLTTCDVVRSICTLPPLPTMEEAYLNCFIERLSPIVGDWIRYNILPQSLRDASFESAEFRAGIQLAATKQDCVPTNPLDIQYRTNYVLEPSDRFCAAANVGVDPNSENWVALTNRLCLNPVCLSSSCPYQGHNCLSLCRSSWLLEETSQSECASVPEKCNWIDCDAHMTNCRKNCESLATPLFTCAYCLDNDPLSCSLAPVSANIQSETECLAAVVCELPDGDIRWDLTASECEALGSCNVECPSAVPVCQSFQHTIPSSGACVSKLITTADACNSASGSSQWINNNDAAPEEGGVCIFQDITSKASCTNGNAWESCETLSQTECSSCASNPSSSTCPLSSVALQRYLLCSVVDQMPCPTEQTCVAQGTCTDAALLHWADSQSGRITSGGCFSPGYFVYWVLDDLSLCLETDRRTPNGCHIQHMNLCPPDANTCNENSLISDVTQCQKVSTIGQSPEYLGMDLAWLNPARTKDQCLFQELGRWGCRIPGDETRYGWQDQESCDKCDGTYGPIFEWVPGTWQKARIRTATWIRRGMYPQVAWQSALAFGLFDSWITQSYTARLTSGLRSEAICRHRLLTQPLDVLSCDCLDPFGPKTAACYSGQDIASTVAFGQLCRAEVSTIKSPSALLLSYPSSIEKDCISAGLAEIDKSVFNEVVLTQSVSFNIAQREKHLATRVVNQQGGRIGQLLGDGCKVSFSPENLPQPIHYTMCLLTSVVYSSSDFPILDIGFTDADFQYIYPYQVADKLFVYIDSLNTSYICANITRELIANISLLVGNTSSRTFFPIALISDWQNQKDNTYSATTIALCYTLGALFCFDLFLLTIFFILVGMSVGRGKGAPVAFWVAVLFAILCVFRICYTFMG